MRSGVRPMLIEPRGGDAEDDASSTKTHSLLAIAGTLLGEINLPKLALAWIILALVPGLLLGVAPLVVTAWYDDVADRILALAGIGPVLVLAGLAAIGWFGLRPLLRAVERSFWSLISLAVQPGYVLAREGLRHRAERFLPAGASEASRARLRGLTAVAAGLGAALIALAITAAVWPATRWSGEVADLAYPLRLVRPALANTIAVMSAYFAGAALLWGIADGTMDQPRDLERFDEAASSDRVWRVAHLSDIHVVGER